MSSGQLDGSPPPLNPEAGIPPPARDAYNYLSQAALQSERIPSSPESNLIRTPPRRKVSLSPIRRLKSREKGGGMTSSEHSSDAEANLVVVENPDGSLVEGMPSGFKHSTPIPSPPRSPRTLSFAATGMDLLDLFHRHEKVFLWLLLITIVVDSIILAEELTTLFAAFQTMGKAGGVQWSHKIGETLPYLESQLGSKLSGGEANMRQTFPVFPPSWTLTSATVVCSFDFIFCVIFFLSGFVAYVSKKRKSYTWFATIACCTLIWQVVLSCVDKLSLVLFLFRLACFTHTRFMGDLMDDIALLAGLIGARVSSQTERAPMRTATSDIPNYQSTF
jgi:hypothetical protein